MQRGEIRLITVCCKIYCEFRDRRRKDGVGEGKNRENTVNTWVIFDIRACWRLLAISQYLF